MLCTRIMCVTSQCAFVVMQAMIEELRTGQPYKLPKEGFVRSKLNAGPTSIEDLVRVMCGVHRCY